MATSKNVDIQLGAVSEWGLPVDLSFDEAALKPAVDTAKAMAVQHFYVGTATATTQRKEVYSQLLAIVNNDRPLWGGSPTTGNYPYGLIVAFRYWVVSWLLVNRKIQLTEAGGVGKDAGDYSRPLNMEETRRAAKWYEDTGNAIAEQCIAANAEFGKEPFPTTWSNPRTELNPF